MQAMASTPFSLISAACWIKPGRCLAEQVGVNAPGKREHDHLLAGEQLVGFHRLGWPSFICISVADGILSPVLMVMAFSLLVLEMLFLT